MILVWQVFPAAFVEGQGLTPFKRASEYLIAFMSVGAMAAFWWRRHHFAPTVLALLLGALGVTALQELAFTLYGDPYGDWNLVGHCLKLVAFYLLYKVVVQNGIARPFDLLFRGVQQREAELERLNQSLELRVEQRTHEARHRAEQLQAMAAELTGAEERERRRLAQMLHDHLQQLLVAANMRVQLAAREVVSGSHAHLAQATDLLEKAIDASRSLTVELSPPVVYRDGLAAGLQWLQVQTRETHGFELAVAADPQVDPLLGENFKIFLFRAARELVFNAVKHAGVPRATVSLARDGDGQVTLEVADDGDGCDLEAPRPAGGVGGYGLVSLRERAELFGGCLHVDSRPGAGMRVRLELPTKAPASAVRVSSP